MNMAEILSRLVLGPIELFYDMTAALFMRIMGDPGMAILGLSVVVGLLATPICRKRNGAGTEKKEILRAVLSLFLQGCCLAASWRFFTSLRFIRGMSFGLIRDLGAPDALIQIGGTAVNLLPILAGICLLAAGLIRTRALPLPHRICCCAAAAGGAILLYGGPSGLALFWAGNSAISLIRQAGGLGSRDMALNVRQQKTDRNNRILLVCCCLYMAVLTGLLIPSEIIGASPAEFMDAHYYRNPDRYLLSSALTACGTFAIWGVAYGMLLSPKGRKHYTLGIAIVGAFSAVDYMFFGGSYGIISSSLRYETGIAAQIGAILLNIGCIAALTALIIFVRKRWPVVLRAFFLYGCIALVVLSVINITKIESKAGEIKSIAENQTDEKATFALDRKGKNVAVIMLDRTINGFVPFILNEKPELAKQFDGFTYYPNTLSYGYHTNIAAPALFGGYEYRPDGLAARAELTLQDKHDEALKVMPVNFLREGYEVTVCDAPYANYQWIPDMSIYDEYPEIRTFNTIGTFDEYKEQIQNWLEHLRDRNLFCYSLFRSAPPALQGILYDNGNYLEMDANANNEGSQLFGVSADFLNSYMVMTNLAGMTEITEEGKNTFLMLTNEMTHNVIELQKPDYTPQKHVDNTEYEAEHGIRYAADGRELDLRNCSELVRIHYDSDMAAFIQLGKWFDELRRNGVYDNTRIIIVSDHGCYLGLTGVNLAETDPGLPDPAEYEKDQWADTTCYNPVLMVKDFGASGFVTDDCFMTNADVPTLAFEGTVADPVNPFTGNPVTSDAKEEAEQHLVESAWDIMTNNGTFFTHPLWITFRGKNIFDPAGWSVEK